MHGQYLAIFNIDCATIGNCPEKAVTLGKGLEGVVQVLIGLVGMLAVIFIIVSGLQMILSAGNAKRYQQGRDSLLYSVVGLIVAILAFAIVSFVAGAAGTT